MAQRTGQAVVLCLLSLWGEQVIVKKLFLTTLLVCTFAVVAGCAKQPSGPLGSKDNPLKMGFVPSLDTNKITLSAKALSAALEQKTGYTIKTTVMTSYAAVIEAMRGDQVDVAWLAPLSYVQARKEVGADVMLISQRGGQTSYYGILLARKDSGIKTIQDFKGKRFAFTDPMSTSGSLYPRELFLRSGINPDKDLKPMFAGKHDAAVIAVYNGQAAGCSVYGGTKTDARDRVTGTFPDVKDKLFIVARTASIPNDNVAANKSLPADMRAKLTKALLDIANSPEGKKMLIDVADIDGLKPAKDSEYDSVREMAKQLNLDLKQAIANEGPKKKTKKG